MPRRYRLGPGLGSTVARMLLPLWLGLAVTASAVAAQEQEAADAVESLILSPEAGESVPQEQVMVAASFVDPEGVLDPESIRIRVGESDVTEEATITPQVVTWKPQSPLPRGPQRVTVSARDRDGEPLPSLNWTFHVTASTSDAPVIDVAETDDSGLPRWARMQGSVILENRTASVSGPGADVRRDEDFLPQLWLNATGTIRPGWRYSTRIHLSGYESSDRQPVNRYRFNLRTPHGSVALGDVNPQLQGLILRGRRIRGVEAELQGGPFGVSVVSGASRRSIEGALDPTDPTELLRRGTYGRSLHAVRPTVGTGDRFQFGLTAMRVRDDVGSIADLRTDPDEGDVTRSATPLPKDNFVVGADVTTRLASERLLVQYENAMSVYANDITEGPLSKTQLDSIMDVHGYVMPMDIDPERWERFFTVNASTIPMELDGRSNAAHRLRTSVRAGTHFISAEFQSVGGSYYSLGNPGLQRDRQGVRIRDSFSLFDQALAVSLGVEQDRDNLDGVKTATTTSRGVSTDVNWQSGPQRPALSGTLRLGSRRNDLSAGEDEALDESNWTVGAGFALPLDLVEGYRTRVNFNWSLINREDPANPAVGSRNAYYLGGIQTETLDRRTEARLLYGLNRTELTELEDARTDFHRISAAGRHQVSERWAALLDGTLTRARTPDSGTNDFQLGLRYDRDELMAGGEFEWTSASYVSFEAGMVRYEDGFDGSENTREVLTRVRVNRPF